MSSPKKPLSKKNPREDENTLGKLKHLEREQEIEAALERVRARTMAMQSSDELNATSLLLFEEFNALGETSSQISIGIFSDDESHMQIYSTIKGKQWDDPVILELKEPVVMKKIFKAWKGKKKSLLLDLTGASLQSYNEYRNSLLTENKFIEDRWVIHVAFFSRGALTFSSTEPYPNKTVSLLERFAKVFDQTYTRFLDLKKAEEQAKEAQIELSLERIRAQATAMRESRDLQDIVVTMRTEFVNLGNEAHYFWHMRWLPERYEKAMTAGDGARIGMVMKLPRHIHGDIPLVDQWEKGKSPTLVFPMDAETAVTYVDKMITLGDFEQLDPNSPSLEDVRNLGGLTFIMARTTHGEIGYSLPGNVPDPPKEGIATLQRFATAFDLAYRRFEDLQQAEAQAREAQVEAALERVRSRSLGMHRSTELREVVDTLYGEFKSLNIEFDVVVIQLKLDETKDLHLWISTEDGLYDNIVYWPYQDMRHFHEMHNASSTQSHLSLTLSKKETTDFFNEYFKLDAVPKGRKAATHNVELIDIMGHYQKHTGVFLMKYSEGFYSAYEKDTTQRFSKVFEQAYTRFLDLEKAEAQAKEAHVEASLERIRSASIAMQNSDQLNNVVELLFKEYQSLAFDSWGCFIGIREKEKEGSQMWMANQLGVFSYHLPELDNPVHKRIIRSWKAGDAINVVKFDGDEKKEYDKVLFSETGLKDLPLEQKKSMMSIPSVTLSIANVTNGFIEAVGEKELPEDQFAILLRFAHVFDQAYTRFLDIQKAEKQAREAQIEAAVERVRSEAMAMHQPSDLVKVTQTLIKEITNLGIAGITGAAFILIDENDIVTMWDISDPGNMGYTRDHKSTYDPKEFNMLGEFWRKWKKGEEYFVIEYDLEKNKKELEEWKLVDEENYQNLKRAIESNKLKTQWNPFGSFSSGLLTLDMMEEPDSDTENIVVKMARTFDLAYQRFDDLQKAAEQAKEARKQASLDRIRAEIASMRNQSDMEKLTPFIWMELSSLGISFFRCGIFIMEEQSKKINMYLSTPAGESIAAMVLDFDNSEITKTASDHWKNQEMFREKWSKEQFIQWSEGLANQGLVDSPDVYQHSAPPDKLCLQFVPFKQGMLYIGTRDFLEENDLDLIQDVADTFSIAYTRYEDFVELEKAKRMAEDALGELRSTQSQLIHAEKMASLGELTAGIAHEIQNPLNFVNNFSDLNTELVDELKEALESGDLEEAKEILQDLKANEEKIIHHGKRAEGIVKGMLQHSRGGDGTKELTDINALADEFLRLSYHGLRAKDKSFNAEFKCTLDPNLPKVEVLSQDIGRVFLNLINNAFHATAEQTKKDASHKPVVEVITQKLDDHIQIQIRDNGAGIPDKIKDKIFQPFFTTKATGSGTGLGLSLSHDIISKGHEGTISLESEVEKGTTFTIQLPIHAS